jgi:AmmeMemoRadiSam system protein B
MATRLARVAGSFYPGSEREIRGQIRAYLEDIAVQVPGSVYGGIVPHAGWVYSGRTALHLFQALWQQDHPETVLLFGAVHTPGLSGPTLYGSGAWRTPLGDVAVDADLAKSLLAADARFVDRPAAHADEHSVEVQIPFVQVLFPQAMILPVSMPPHGDAQELGTVAAQVVQRSGKRVAVVGSTDLTHYGPHYGIVPAGTGEPGLAWARANDRRLLDLVVALETGRVLGEAHAHYNACGPGAVVVTMAMTQALGATRGQLLDYTTSYDVMPRGRPSDLVGYGAVAFAGG